MSARPILTLLGHAWARHRVPLIAIAAAVGLFEFILTRVAPSPNEASWIGMIISTLPPDVRTLLGNEVALSSGGFLAFGYAHPFFILLLSAWVVRTSSASVADEISRGTMDLLASRPVERWHFVAAGMAAVCFGLMVILAGALAATAFGLRLRPLDIHVSAFFRVALVTWLLFAAWGAIGLVVSASRRSGSQAIAWTTAILAGSFVLDYLARLWAPISRLRPLSLFRYYEPQAIVAGGVSRLAVLTLAGVIVVSLCAGVVLIQRRDL